MMNVFGRLKVNSKMLDQWTIPVVSGGVTTETELYQYTVKGGTLGANGEIRILISFTNKSSANNKTVKVKFGSTQIASFTVTTNTQKEINISIKTRNNEAAQICTVTSQGVTTVTTLAEDTSADKAISVTATTTTESAVSVTGITSTGVTALVHAPTHGFVLGEYVLMEGANETEYNGTYQIFDVSENYYKYLFAGSVTTPATGTITAKRYTPITLESVDVELVKV